MDLQLPPQELYGLMAANLAIFAVWQTGKFNHLMRLNFTVRIRTSRTDVALIKGGKYPKPLKATPFHDITSYTHHLLTNVITRTCK